MKNINKFLIATSLLTSSLGLAILTNESFNNQFENNGIEQLTKDTYEISSQANQDTHGNVDFGTASIVNGNPTSDVTVVTNGFIEGTSPDANLNDNLALAIYKEDAKNKSEYLGYTPTTITEIISFGANHPWTISLDSGKSFENGIDYKVKAARQKSNDDTYDVLLNTKATFTYWDILIVDEPIITTPEPNEDGAIIYQPNDISITLKLATGILDNNDIDASLAKIEIVDKDGNPLDPEVVAATTYTDGTFTLAPDTTLIVPASHVEAGHGIVLTGVKYKTMDMENIEIATIDPIVSEEPPVIEDDDGLSVGEIVAIVAGSLLAIGLLGSGGYWFFNKYSISKD